MEIIKQGEYPEKNRTTCKHCGCEFKFYDEECEMHYTDEDESSFFGGYGFCKSIKCPVCKTKCIIDWSFEPYEPSQFMENFVNAMHEMGQYFLMMSNGFKEALAKLGRKKDE